MTDKKHAWTAEPWELDSGSASNPSGHVWKGGRLIAGCRGYSSSASDYGPEQDANAARIVACVNALAGIDDPVEWRLLVTTAIEVRRWWLASPHDPQFQNAAMRKMVEAIDALLALQPPTEEEASDGR